MESINDFSKEAIKPSVTLEIFDPKINKWDDVKDEIIKVEELALPEFEPQEETDKADFENPDNTVVIMRSEDQIIGFTYAEPVGNIFPERSEESKDTAYVTLTAILPDFQKRGLLRILLGKLDETLKEKGYSFVEREAFTRWEYPTKLRHLYQERILEEKGPYYDNDQEEMVQFFRIKL